VEFTESMLIALFCMAVVFAVLAILWALIRLFSLVVRKLEGTNGEASETHN
jgi:Na+-transporting methylmalonyl-CoA/oxaloacetate decarboxylase gamma subunit